MVWLLHLLLIANLAVGSWDALVGLTGPDTRADFVFGTFGVNSNQMALFLACLLAHQLARWRFLGVRRTQLWLLGHSSVLILLCGFQTLWVVLPMAVAAVLALGRFHARLLPILLAAVVVPGLVLSTVSLRCFEVSHFLSVAINRFDDTGQGQLLHDTPAIMASGPWGFLVGVAPGTFKSRAFRSIALTPGFGGGTCDVAVAIVLPFFTSELSEQYLWPHFERGRILLRGANTAAPFTSYLSILIETGGLGALAPLGIYVLRAFGLLRSLRRGRDAWERMLAAWALICQLMVLGIARLDDYLETSRYTLLVWHIVALWRVYRQRRGPVLAQR